MHKIDTPVDYRVGYRMQWWNAIKNMPMMINIAELKTVLCTLWNDLLQAFIDIKAIVSFWNKVWSCVAAAGWHSKHRV